MKNESNERRREQEKEGDAKRKKTTKNQVRLKLEVEILTENKKINQNDLHISVFCIEVMKWNSRIRGVIKMCYLHDQNGWTGEQNREIRNRSQNHSVGEKRKWARTPSLEYVCVFQQLNGCTLAPCKLSKCWKWIRRYDAWNQHNLLVHLHCNANHYFPLQRPAPI